MSRCSSWVLMAVPLATAFGCWGGSGVIAGDPGMSTGNAGAGGGSPNTSNSSDGCCACRLVPYHGRPSSGAILPGLGIVATYGRRRRRAKLSASQRG